MPFPPEITLVNPDGTKFKVSTIPPVGRASADESLPVVLAQGVDPTRVYLEVPSYKSGDDTTIAIAVAYNPQRRYLKIINNGAGDVELWNKNKPQAAQVGQNPSQAEVLAAGGGGLLEAGERISLIYATSIDGSALVILEG